MAKKKKRGKNSKNKRGNVQDKRAIQFKGEMQEYVLMTKMLGDRRIMVKLPDTSEKLAIIPGRFRKRCWMKPGDVLLASYREFQENKLDIVHKYNPDEARRLVGFDEIPSFFLDIGASGVKEEETGITFAVEDDIEFSFDDI
jgi:translation initiation factor 1A